MRFLGGLAWNCYRLSHPEKQGHFQFPYEEPLTWNLLHHPPERVMGTAQAVSSSHLCRSNSYWWPVLLRSHPGPQWFDRFACPHTHLTAVNMNIFRICGEPRCAAAQRAYPQPPNTRCDTTTLESRDFTTLGIIWQWTLMYVGNSSGGIKLQLPG